MERNARCPLLARSLPVDFTNLAVYSSSAEQPCFERVIALLVSQAAASRFVP